MGAFGATLGFLLLLSLACGEEEVSSAVPEEQLKQALFSAVITPGPNRQKASRTATTESPVHFVPKEPTTTQTAVAFFVDNNDESATPPPPSAVDDESNFVDADDSFFVNSTSEALEEATGDDNVTVDIFQAPLVVAFTVQQDGSTGLTKNISPLEQESKNVQSFNNKLPEEGLIQHVSTHVGLTLETQQQLQRIRKFQEEQQRERERLRKLQEQQRLEQERILRLQQQQQRESFTSQPSVSFQQGFQAQNDLSRPQDFGFQNNQNSFSQQFSSFGGTQGSTFTTQQPSNNQFFRGNQQGSFDIQASVSPSVPTTTFGSHRFQGPFSTFTPDQRGFSNQQQTVSLQSSNSFTVPQNSFSQTPSNSFNNQNLLKQQNQFGFSQPERQTFNNQNFNNFQSTFTSQRGSPSFNQQSFNSPDFRQQSFSSNSQQSFDSLSRNPRFNSQVATINSVQTIPSFQPQRQNFDFRSTDPQFNKFNNNFRQTSFSSQNNFNRFQPQTFSSFTFRPQNIPFRQNGFNGFVDQVANFNAPKPRIVIAAPRLKKPFYNEKKFSRPYSQLKSGPRLDDDDSPLALYIVAPKKPYLSG